MELVKNFINSKIIKYVFLALIGSIILAVSSKVKIPFYPVPMTMQTFVVLFLGVSLGYKIGLDMEFISSVRGVDPKLLEL